MNAGQIADAANHILESNPDPVVGFRLQRDVLGIPASDLGAQKTELDTNPWVKQLVREQHPDGSWGRFHSRDSQSKQKTITTEFGVERGLALGLDTSHLVFCRTIDYLTQLLSGQIDFPDPAEQNDRWPAGTALFSAATLALLKPNHPFVDLTWALWANIATQIFKRGEYDPEAEIQAHRVLTGATVKDSYLVLNNKYTLTLLSTRIQELPDALSSQVLSWVWNHPQGVKYLGVPPAKLPVALKPGLLDRWFSTHELLSRFQGWRDQAGRLVDWLMSKQGEDGLWDFGMRSVSSHYFPLSPDWRKPINRKSDWSTRTLVLLSRFLQ